ncbi:LacI family DNA-binding transcriptional regulator [Chryseosolibacter indicus]|uniref:LacI family transcriptional regulator n=1 Tax=Chryseosolibacter indicus TaxID=2782351 RepID=A0ABS5VJZ0_9BACT|nr:LacI family DNA-binding transcriptional regulator [Chryseosolibacter indicus]MBT1701757.1 LacI family transcriptional regulator [Chryseosolibacter indicus]
MEKKLVTIKDIAKTLGISKSTVSRALCGRTDIHPDTKKKIIELARSLNYEPNALAINLKQQRTNTIGVIIPETVNGFFARATGGIQKRADMAGMNVMICQSDESYIIEKKNIHSLMSGRVDGVIISVSHETDQSEHFAALQQKGIPMVFFDRISEDLETSQIITNNHEIAFEGTNHLISQGCKRIAYVAGPHHLNNSKNRLHGYLDALKQHNIEVQDSYIIHSSYKSDKVEEYTRYLLNLPQRPDAVFAINDFAAVEMMHILKKSGLRIPDDIAILGFNNENISRFVEPSLSSIDHPAYDIGMAAAEVLINQIRHPELKPEKRIVKSKLIIRESTQKQPQL